jgi:hypothetical protein
MVYIYIYIYITLGIAWFFIFVLHPVFKKKVTEIMFWKLDLFSFLRECRKQLFCFPLSPIDKSIELSLL